jgi:hypothetical protein
MHFDIFFSFSKMDLGDGPPADRLLTACFTTIFSNKFAKPTP